MSPLTEHTQAAAHARSLLFVPGQRPERFAKALASPADALVLDLEDAVPPADKAAARQAIAAEWPRLAAQAKPVLVRINAAGTAAHADDLAWLATLRPWPIVMLAKAESAEGLLGVLARLPGLALLPLIESAQGCARLAEIAAVPGVLRLVLGHLDFLADTGMACGEDQRELDPLRFALAVQTRLNGLGPAVDGVTVSVQDEALLRADTERALRFGFGARLCIHPQQVAVVHQAMAPTPEQLEWARRVLAADAAAGGAAVQLDGRMVDLPVVLAARRTLARVPQA